MSKYDKAMIFNDNTSSGKIAGFIQKGSRVLEFGCATGQFTRFLRDSLECSVFIVEIEEEAFECAVQFAEDGICTDITEFAWCDRIEENSFDVIVFADVLEHLKNPKEVLRRTWPYLKEDGKVLISIPNIAHNDILANLYMNKFEYTDTGLLDNTHIHFWAYQDLCPFIAGTGYRIIDLDGTFVSAFDTEQKILVNNEQLRNIRSILSNRPLGTVFQFIMCLQKESYIQENSVACHNHLFDKGLTDVESSVYFDCGEGFSENDKEVIQWPSCSEQFQFEIRIREGVSRIRIDFIEKKFCVVENIEIFSAYGQLGIADSNGFIQKDCIIFLTTDPWVIVQIPEEVSWLKISGRMAVTESKVWYDVLNGFISDNYCYPFMEPAKCYCDYGVGFNEANVIRSYPSRENDGSLCYQISFDKPVKQFRFDFVEDQSCFISDIRISSNVSDIEVYPSGIGIGNGYVLYGTDPWLRFVSRSGGIRWVKIKTQLIKFQETGITALVSERALLAEKLGRAEAEAAQEKKEVGELAGVCEELRQQIEVLKRHIEEMEKRQFCHNR